MRLELIWPRPCKSLPLPLSIPHKILWWNRSGSNRQPLACKASALPVELRPHSIVIFAYVSHQQYSLFLCIKGCRLCILYRYREQKAIAHIPQRTISIVLKDRHLIFDYLFYGQHDTTPMLVETEGFEPTNLAAHVYQTCCLTRLAYVSIFLIAACIR